MDNTEFKNMYGDYLAHKWVTSREQQKKAEQDIEGKINRAVSRSAKKVSDIVNSAKAAIQTAKDVYNNTLGKTNKIKTSVQRTLNKYFG